MHAIDPPSPFAPFADWIEFRDELASLNSDEPDMLDAINDANNEIASKQP